MTMSMPAFFLNMALALAPLLAAQQGPPAMFVFGDSLVDAGNNNNLRSIAKANFFPYGIDFAAGPTGRFCNGRTIVDALCDLLGLPYVPAYSTPGLNGSALLGGVNYASAAGGILDETGIFMGERYSLEEQVLNFESNLDELRAALGDSSLADFLSKSIAVTVFGSNDYINNYLLPELYASRSRYSPDEYADLLIRHYSRQLLALRSLGLRKFMVAGVGPLGCIPNQRAAQLDSEAGECVSTANHAVRLFNAGLRSLVQQLNADQSAVFLYANTYSAFEDILNNPVKYGFKVTDSGCCGLGRFRGQLSCFPFALPCFGRSQNVFWDAYHPTEAVNLILARRAYAGPLSDMYPMNLRKMIQL